METIELKFVLKLLGCENYRGKIEHLKPNDKTRAPQRDKICRNLTEREIVAHSRKVVRFKIQPTGERLLHEEITELPITDEQLTVLKACQKKSITPGKLKLPAAERQTVIQDLEAKGFIKSEKVEIKEVWLTERGREYLRDEVNVSGTGTISLNLLQNYLNFSRRGNHHSPVPANSLQPLFNGSTNGFTSLSSPSESAHKPSDQEILHIIEDLDQELGTKNYLPIFHLRQKLQPSMSRDELDQALYRLQRQDKIEMSSLVEAVHYTSEQIQAGISQGGESPLFFIFVNE